MKKRWWRGASPVRFCGGLLVLAAAIGFLTVADDLRHKGELVGVGSILVAGIVLLAVPVRRGPRSS